MLHRSKYTRQQCATVNRCNREPSRTDTSAGPPHAHGSESPENRIRNLIFIYIPLLEVLQGVGCEHQLPMKRSLHTKMVYKEQRVKLKLRAES